MEILKILENEFSLKTYQVENTVTLIDEGNTIPFISRYRKEMTGSIDDQTLREIYDRLVYLRNMEERLNQVKETIREQGNLTEEIEAALKNAKTMTEIEDIYRPFKPKRRTRAMIAKEKGLEPLAQVIWNGEAKHPLPELAMAFIDAEKEINSSEDALNGAMDIIAEVISDNAEFRSIIRKEFAEKGFFDVKATDKEKESVYEMYYSYSEPVRRIAPHRILAVNRGEKENFLTVKIEVDEENILNRIFKEFKGVNQFSAEFLESALKDSYKRLIAPSIEREVRSSLTENAEEGAIKVFSENLQMLLLQPPIKDKTVLALDPGFRTGCKFSVIDNIGKVLETGVIYPTPPKSQIKESMDTLIPLIHEHKVDIVAIGNGTASRETEAFTAEMLHKIDRKVSYIIVNEAGASVYSASKLGAEEFPEYDVALRSAVSIGRRIQDPLAELVKIDPKSIGVGQYQHDMNQKRLGEALKGVVEYCVNTVGVDLNTASPSLLSYVAGISPALSKNILEYREENGKFTSRKQLLKVKKLGPKAFEQCAGFLRLSADECKDILDSTGVHPESYKACETLLKKTGYTKEDIKNKRIKDLSASIENIKELSEELGIGTITLLDIIKELEKPGRDPREDMPPQILRSDVLSMEDLTEGMILKGTVRNVIDFGAFVDIGVHQDALVHISQISDKFIKHPLDAVSVGDIVDVKVLSIDINKKRVALTMKING